MTKIIIYIWKIVSSLPPKNEGFSFTFSKPAFLKAISKYELILNYLVQFWI